MNDTAQATMRKIMALQRKEGDVSAVAAFLRNCKPHADGVLYKGDLLITVSDTELTITCIDPAYQSWVKSYAYTLADLNWTEFHALLSQWDLSMQQLRSDRIVNTMLAEWLEFWRNA